jgi:peroxiredoxin Q/BCP
MRESARRTPFLHALLALCCVSGLGCGSVQRSDGGHGLLPEGRRAPLLNGVDQAGKQVHLRRIGGFVLVYFYPKDGTPGCTKEACAFRDAWDRYQAAGVTLLGVSADSVESHREFAEEHQLPFSLISDPDHVWSDAFGVGTFVGLTERVSFLIGPEGNVAKVYPEVDPGVHSARVLDDVARLAKPPAP